MSLSQRKQYARQCFYKGRTNTRRFDNCFEQGDGGEVVKYLMTKTETDTRLKRAIQNDGYTWEFWNYFITHGTYQDFQRS